MPIIKIECDPISQPTAVNDTDQDRFLQVAEGKFLVVEPRVRRVDEFSTPRKALAESKKRLLRQHVTLFDSQGRAYKMFRLGWMRSQEDDATVVAKKEKEVVAY